MYSHSVRLQNRQSEIGNLSASTFCAKPLHCPHRAKSVLGQIVVAQKADLRSYPSQDRMGCLIEPLQCFAKPAYANTPILIGLHLLG